MAAASPRNADVADKLRHMAELLSRQHASQARVARYHDAAAAIDRLELDLAELIDRDGIDGLAAIPAVGGTLAATVHEIVRTGHFSSLDRLAGTLDVEGLFRSVPGIGPELAHRIHEHLHVETLEELEQAAWDGRLEAIPGVGARRVLGLRASLASVIQHARRRPSRARPTITDEPALDDLLDVDREYRTRAAEGSLPRIAPRRFNPTGAATLPVLHTQRGRWHFSVLFSNTGRAHTLGKERDWVIVYFYDGDHRERQRTVVTETHGSHRGERVVRGRERESREDDPPVSRQRMLQSVRGFLAAHPRH